jgi:hypothetical protein
VGSSNNSDDDTIRLSASRRGNGAAKPPPRQDADLQLDRRIIQRAPLLVAEAGPRLGGPRPTQRAAIQAAPAPRRSPIGLFAGLAGAAILSAGLLTWMQWPTARSPEVSRAAVFVPPSVIPIPIGTAAMVQILGHVTPDLTITRLAENPRILVADFASLTRQGRMLDRVAAMVEKAGQPRDRLLTPVEIADAVRTGGDTSDGFYYGHDYGADSLTRFFAMAERGQVSLNSDEAYLLSLLRQEQWLAPGARFGLISIPRVGADPNLDQAARAAIFYHELAHGEYFANPAHEQYVHLFWRSKLRDGERDGVRTYLNSQGYDADNQEVVENEMQAYLMFTYDPRFFTAPLMGLTSARLRELREAFHAGMPAGWLRNLMAELMAAEPPPRSIGSH